MVRPLAQKFLSLKQASLTHIICNSQFNGGHLGSTMIFSLNIFHAGFAGVTTIMNNLVLCIVLLALVKY